VDRRQRANAVTKNRKIRCCAGQVTDLAEVIPVASSTLAEPSPSEEG
jgi:hypothetical protein